MYERKNIIRNQAKSSNRDRIGQTVPKRSSQEVRNKQKTSGTHATGLTHECHSLYGIIILLHKKSAGHSAQIARCKLCGKSPLKPWSGLYYNRKERKHAGKYVLHSLFHLDERGAIWQSIKQERSWFMGTSGYM